MVRSRETLFLFAKKPIDISNITTRSDRKCCHAFRIFAIPENSLGGRVATQSWPAASRGLLANDSLKFYSSLNIRVCRKPTKNSTNKALVIMGNMFLQMSRVSFRTSFSKFRYDPRGKGKALPYRSRTQRIEKAAKHPFTSAHKDTGVVNAKAEETFMCKKLRERDVQTEIMQWDHARRLFATLANSMHLIESLHRSFQRYQLWFLCSKMM